MCIESEGLVKGEMIVLGKSSCTTHAAEINGIPLKNHLWKGALGNQRQPLYGTFIFISATPGQLTQHSFTSSRQGGQKAKPLLILDGEMQMQHTTDKGVFEKGSHTENVCFQFTKMKIKNSLLIGGFLCTNEPWSNYSHRAPESVRQAELHAVCEKRYVMFSQPRRVEM